MYGKRGSSIVSLKSVVEQQLISVVLQLLEDGPDEEHVYLQSDTLPIVLGIVTFKQKIPRINGYLQLSMRVPLQKTFEGILGY